MFKSTMASLGVFVLIMIPSIAMAQPGNKGPGDRQDAANAPTPNPSAYEHSGENAKFQRDTHDMGKHAGQEVQKGEDKDKDYDQGTGKDKKKGEKGKAKSKDETAKGKKQPSTAKEKEKPTKDKDKELEAQSDNDKLLEKAHKVKPEKVK